MCGELLSSREVDSSGISSSAAVGIACLLALEAVSGLSLPVLENIELDRCALDTCCSVAFRCAHEQTDAYDVQLVLIAVNTAVSQGGRK